MATARTSCSALSQRVSELSTCPICIEEVQGAKVLPCLHTFCLQCLKNYWKDKAGGDRVCCPVCRQVLTIPPDGLDGLQNNFFLQHLMDVDNKGKWILHLLHYKPTYILCLAGNGVHSPLINASTILQIGQLMFGIVCLTMLYCLIQLTVLNLNFINSETPTHYI